jgi:hypothetical protein
VESQYLRAPDAPDQSAQQAADEHARDKELQTSV